MRSSSSSDQRRRTGVPDEDGFTLIEILIVILMLGVLAAIVAFALGTFTSQSAVAACNTDAKSVENAALAYQATNSGNHPTSVGQLTNTPGAGDTGGPYLRTALGNTTTYVITISGGKTYVQLNSGDPARKMYGYTATGITTPVAYDTFSWGGATALSGLNVCAGA
ncbi:MAG: prepilin-type N-terminal cleavage/methylation domain-containing protein [Acidimicrobiales bacterium]